MQVCLLMCTSVLPRKRAVDWGGGEPASLWQIVIQGGYKNREKFSVRGWLKKSEYVAKY